MLQGLIDSQRRLSRRLDALLPERFTLDGNREFLRLAPLYLKEGMTVWDLGGGKQPLVNPQRKRELKLTVVGLDISARELALAPPGAYDRTVVGDITDYRGESDADLVICQALLEHVRDTASAFRGISSILKPGGRAIIFTPSRNAAFARLNLALPQSLKEWVLFTVYPQSRGQQGFPAYYDRCTPQQFRRLAEASSLILRDQHLYYQSNYFTFAFPLHLVWRLWMVLFASASPESAAETFTMIFAKN